MSQTSIITLVGCGRMGGAMLRGWLESNIDARYNVIDPGGKPDFIDAYNDVTYLSDPKDIVAEISKSNICILAVKPQIMNDICKTLAPMMPKSCVILSIAAGQGIAAFENSFGTTHPIIRAMPNTPAAIGKGMSVLCANSHVSADQKALAAQLLAASGKIEWIEDEALMNAVTAVSGSGPAYIFYLIEALAKAGEGVGLNKDMAMALARQTVIGSAALTEHDADTSAATLRENVTSPGGTTQAALEVLMDGRMQDIFNEALTAARDRGEALNT